MKRYKVIYKTTVEADTIFEAFAKELLIEKDDLECVCIGEITRKEDYDEP